MPAVKLDRSKLESQIQASITAFARKKGWTVVKLQSIARRGFPDLLIMGEGWAVFFEVKRPQGEVQPHQRALIGIMDRAELQVYVVRSVTAAKDILMLYATEVRT